MKTVTIRFEFPDQRNGIPITHQEIVDIINGSLYDMESEFSKEVHYTIVGRS